MSRGDWDGAAEQARLIPGDDPFSGLAARIELCSIIGRAPAETVGTALERARRAGIPAAEHTVFQAWAAIAAGDEAPGGTSMAGAPLLGALLETLLRGRDIARFQALLPALERSRLEPRERHELLAELYLGQGLLAQAAQEWMAASQPEPDARSLFGLARVSQRHGLAQDAVTFVTGALELDPGHAQARQLLAELEPARVAVAA